MAILFWPGITVATIIIFIGVYGIIKGLVVFFEGVFAHKGTPDRALRVVMGILGVLFGILVLNVPVAFAAFGLLFIAALIGIWGIYDVVASFSHGETTGHRVLLFIAGALAILFSLWVFFNPLVGAQVLVFFLALLMIVTGAMEIVVGASLPKEV